ncbi:hypothetical protein NBRGN_078_00360 [Nocardia brasiliensis NBRC 14402]|uniref:hypothetical protein n=1 Tax=Nocardia brasiliensis TaxID=37326 RepID=UPI00030A1E68|nr:hypothetical protein [Nocardia brasiliensis]ASF06629.1 hypothetical protein CEQ30_03945 [Nocardia brasiliensis]GAJ84674.1 hypothetical protein NBRGN_078_00360 [Nocardia brasiliensis NBRC 14402]SUB48214.1 Uncharacterised protein [Nocardia brasiliensis]
MGFFGRKSELRTGFEHEYVTLPDPGLPDAETRQVLYRALCEIGLADIVFGPGDVRECFRALTSVAPVFRNTVSDNRMLGRFSGEPDVFWYALQGSAGAAIVMSFGPESEDSFRQVQIDGPLSRTALQTPFEWGTVLGLGASVPVGFARIFADATLQPLSALPGLEHFRQPDENGSGAGSPADEPTIMLPQPPPELPIQIGYRLLATAPQSVLVYSAATLSETFAGVYSAAPVFGATSLAFEDGWVGALPAPSVQWFGVDGPAGSAVVVTAATSADFAFLSTEVMPQVGSLPSAFTCGIADRTVVPQSFARLFTRSDQRPIWELPGMRHLRQP